jgi:hypothetical protein
MDFSIKLIHKATDKPILATAKWGNLDKLKVKILVKIIKKFILSFEKIKTNRNRIKLTTSVINNLVKITEEKQRAKNTIFPLAKGFKAPKFIIEIAVS